jgi:hypothetical protein
MKLLCNAHTIQTLLVRLFAVALVGTGVWFGSEQLANQLHLSVTDPVRLGASLLAGIACWFVAARAIAAAQFTQDCLDVPTALAPTLTSKSKPADQGRLLPKLSPAPALTNKLPESGALVDTDKVHIETSGNADGTLKVVVTAKLTNNQFKGHNGSMLNALQSVKGSTWARHSNLGEGKGKRVEGTIAAQVDRQKALVHLKSIGEKFSQA